MMLALAEVDGFAKWAVDQGAMAVMLFGLASFAAWVTKRLVDKWIGTLEKTDTHLDASTKAMNDISLSLSKIGTDVSETKNIVIEINRHTQPKGPTTG